MNCMKCGREVALGQVFCKECLADMAQYPVPPGTPVILPNRDTAVAPRRTAPRKTRKPEEQISALRKTILFLMIVLVAVSLAFAAVTVMLHLRLQEQETAPDQNTVYPYHYSEESFT